MSLASCSEYSTRDGHRELYRAMVGKQGYDLGLRAVRKLLTEILTEHLRGRLAVETASQLELAVAFLVSGLIGLTTWWLDSEAPLSADEVFASFERLASHGIESLLAAPVP